MIGRSSALWTRIAGRVLAARPATLAVGHREIDQLQLSDGDQVWIFSYAPDEDANRRLLERLAARGSARHIYVSTATANIAGRIRCYRYPRVKAEAERDAARILGAETVRIGLIHDNPDELPAGFSVVTRLDDLVAAIVDPGRLPRAEGGVGHLYNPVERPFSGAVERMSHNGYGALLRLCGSQPCLLRPLDLLLRSIGWRWYGYFRLSNEQCRTTT